MGQVELRLRIQVNFEDLTWCWFLDNMNRNFKTELAITKKERELYKAGDHFDKLVTLCRILSSRVGATLQVFKAVNGGYTTRIEIVTDDQESLERLGDAVKKAITEKSYKPPKEVREFAQIASELTYSVDLFERPPKERQ